MGRFLQIQIYNEQGTEIEYDNYIDDSWGIQTGSASIEKILMSSELKFGEIFSSIFQVQLFGIDADISHRKIKVKILKDVENNYIVTDDGDVIVTDAGDRLVHTDTSSSTIDLFTGIIDSNKKDRIGTDRTIIAYDRFYELRNFNVLDFWNDFWENNETTTLRQLKTALYNSLGLNYIPSACLNDNLVVSNPTKNQEVTLFQFVDLVRNIYQLQNACPHIDGNGNVIEIQLNPDKIRSLSNKLEGTNSNWEDFTTKHITGVGVYGTSSELEQLVGTNDNVYSIVGNLFLLDMTAEQLTEVCTDILDDLSIFTYRPGTFKLVLPYDEVQLGDALATDYGVAYAFNIRYAGPVLINETISCPTSSDVLSQDIRSLNDIQFVGSKQSQIIKDIDKLEVDFVDLSENVESEISQMADEIVLKVDANGNIVEVALGSSASEGSTFDVNADNITFKANSTLNLLASNLNIQSTKLSITPAGKITATDADFDGKVTATTMLFWDTLNMYSSYGQYEFPLADMYWGGSDEVWTKIKAPYGQGGRDVIYLMGPSQGAPYGDYAGVLLGDWKVTGKMVVSGTKPRVVETKDYGARTLYCYETASPMFGDLGDGEIAEDGKCYVWLDRVFAETITTNSYQVFLQKCGEGDCWVSERKPNYFVVEGTAGLSFCWELKAKQSDFDQRRLEPENLYTHKYETDYGESAINHINKINHEREVV